MKTFLTAVAGGKMRKSLQSSVTAVSISAFLDGVGTDVISVIRNTGMFFIMPKNKTSLTMYLIKRNSLY